MYMHFVTITCSLLMSPGISIVQSEKVIWKKETPVVLGRDAKLFCDASAMPECCEDRTRRWVIGPSDDVLLSNGVSTNVEKYTEILREGGFTLLIKNVTVNDVNISYTCSYEFEQYTDVLVLDDIIKTEKENSGYIVVPVAVSVVVVVLIVLVIVLVCYIRRVRHKDNYDATEAMTFHGNDDKNRSDIPHDKQNDNLIEVKNSDVIATEDI